MSHRFGPREGLFFRAVDDDDDDDDNDDGGRESVAVAEAAEPETSPERLLVLLPLPPGLYRTTGLKLEETALIAPLPPPT